MNSRKRTIIKIILYCIFFSSCAPGTAVPSPAPTATKAATIVPTATIAPTITPMPVTYLLGLSTNIPEPGPAFIQQVVSENYLSG